MVDVWNVNRRNINTDNEYLIIINITGGGKIEIFIVLIFFHAFTQFVMITFVQFKIRAFCNYQVMRLYCCSTLLYI